jgi:hypothetical protein
MKFKTFRVLAIGGGLLFLLVAGGVGYATYEAWREPTWEELEELNRPRREEEQARLARLGRWMSRKAREAAAASPVTTATTPLAGLDPVSSQVLERALEGIGGSKTKDALKGAAFKVNLYAAGADGRVSRLKLDLDRDGRWDEKWTFDVAGEAEAIRRQVSSKDDEDYNEEYLLLGGEGWVAK